MTRWNDRGAAMWALYHPVLRDELRERVERAFEAQPTRHEIAHPQVQATCPVCISRLASDIVHRKVHR